MQKQQDKTGFESYSKAEISHRKKFIENIHPENPKKRIS